MDRSLRSLVGGAGLRTAGSLIRIVIGVFLTPFLLRTLGEGEYAVFVFTGLFTNWCGLVDFGMTTASSRFVTLCWSQKNEERLNETANTASFLFAGMGLCVLAAAVAAAFLFQHFSDYPDAGACAPAFLIAGAAFAVSKLSDAVSGVINGVMRQEVTGMVSFLFPILTGGAVFFAAWYGGNVVAVTAGNFAVFLIHFLVLAFLVKRIWPPIRFSLRYIRKERMKELFCYSVYTFVNQLGTLLVRRSDLIVIGTFLTLNDVTYYNLTVVTFISCFLSLLEAMTLWETNWFTHLQESGEMVLFEKSRIRSSKWMTFAVSFISGMIIFWVPDFITFWVGEEYLQTFPALILMAGGIALYRGPAEVNIRLLQGIAKHQPLAYYAVVQGIAGLLFSILAVKFGYGLMGVAVGTIVPAILINGILIPIYVCRLMNESPIYYFARNIGWLILSAAAFVPSLIFLQMVLSPNPILLLCAGIGAFMAYLAMIWLIGLDSEEKKIVRGFLFKYKE